MEETLRCAQGDTPLRVDVGLQLRHLVDDVVGGLSHTACHHPQYGVSAETAQAIIDQRLKSISDIRDRFAAENVERRSKMTATELAAEDEKGAKRKRDDDEYMAAAAEGHDRLKARFHEAVTAAKDGRVVNLGRLVFAS